MNTSNQTQLVAGSSVSKNGTTPESVVFFLNQIIDRHIEVLENTPEDLLEAPQFYAPQEQVIRRLEAIREEVNSKYLSN